VARFYIGQPVVCVDDRLRRHVVRRYPGIRWPVAGVHYVIRGIIENDKLTFVTLREIKNATIRWPNGARAEAGFSEDRFEPATDIGDLTRVAEHVGNFMGEPLVDEPDKHPTAPRKKETVE
jgi:hypothetical protein